MATSSLEERVAELEAEVKQLKQKHNAAGSQDNRPWWEQIRGTVKDDPDYDEAMRLGREYRESLRPKDDEDV